MMELLNYPVRQNHTKIVCARYYPYPQKVSLAWAVELRRLTA